MGLELTTMFLASDILVKSGVLSEIIKRTNEKRKKRLATVIRGAPPSITIQTREGARDVDSLSEKEIEMAVSSSESLETLIKAPAGLSEERLRIYDMEVFEDASNSTEEIYQERIRQARQSFNIASIILIIGLIALFLGIIIAFLGLMPQGITVAAIGTAFEALGAIILKLNKDANDRIDKLGERANCMKNTLVALEITQRLSRKYLKDQATMEIIRDIMENCGQPRRILRH